MLILSVFLFENMLLSFSVAKCRQNYVICIEICKQNVCILANMSQLLPKMMFQTHFCCFFLNQIYDLTTRKSCTRFSLLYNKILILNWEWSNLDLKWLLKRQNWVKIKAFFLLVCDLKIWRHVLDHFGYIFFTLCFCTCVSVWLCCISTDFRCSFL